jgi:hypothetical protein
MMVMQWMQIGTLYSPVCSKDGYHYAEDHIVPHRHGDVSVLERKRCHNKPQARD